MFKAIFFFTLHYFSCFILFYRKIITFASKFHESAKIKKQMRYKL